MCFLLPQIQDFPGWCSIRFPVQPRVGWGRSYVPKSISDALSLPVLQDTISSTSDAESGYDEFPGRQAFALIHHSGFPIEFVETTPTPTPCTGFDSDQLMCTYQ